jgi:hypothetical protein
MSLSSSLSRIGRSLALMLLALAALFFIVFALSPTIELLPDGMDLLIGVLLSGFVLVWLITGRKSRSRR